MSKILRLRRGNTAAHLTFTGKSAEVTVDTDKNTLVVHDNVTVGGHPIATQSYVDNILSNIIAGNINLGDIDINANTITTVNTNQDLVLDPNGTGNVVVGTNVVPDLDNTRDLGSPAKQWRHVYTAGGSIYIDNIKLTNVNGKLVVTKVINPGAENEAPDPVDSNAASNITSKLINGQYSFSLENDGTLALNGSPYSPGGGANTGDVTFSGIKIIGAGTASGDGNEYSTLELVPDNNLYANDQYLILDPTTPNHIHIRAGGTQDASNAYLYLGGEATYVMVHDNGGVFLNSQELVSNGYQYTTGVEFTNGSWYEDTGSYYIEFTTTNQGLINTFWAFTNMQQNSVVVYDGTNYNTATYGGTASAPGNDLYRVKVKEAPPANPTTINQLSYTIYSTNYNSVSLSNSSFSTYATNDVGITGGRYFTLTNNSGSEPVNIITNGNSNSHTWSFRSNGALALPNGVVIGPSIYNGSATNITANNGTWVGLENNNGHNNINVDDNQVSILTNNNNIWRFLLDGKLRFPNGTDQITAWTGAVDTLYGTITPATGDIVTDVRHWESAGNNLYIWFDASNKPDVMAIANFGDITGWTVSVSDGNSATVTVTNPAGFYSISTDQALTGSGTLTFTSPSYVPATPNNLILSTGNKNWTFGTGGSLIVPGVEDDSTAAVDFFAGAVGNHKFTLASDWTLKLKARALGANEGHLVLEAGQNTKININGNGSNVKIVASDGSTQAEYLFEKNGTIDLPGGSKIVANGSNVGIATGTSNIAITNNANITMGVAGNAAVMTVTASNVNVTGNIVATADLWTGTGNLRTSGSTGNIFNFDATTINMGGAATTVNIGNASGVINLSGNVQGSTNGFAIGYRDIPQVSFTANATISTSDAGKHYYSTSASNLTFTIANNASQGFSIGAAIKIVNQGTGNITIAQDSGVTLYMAGNSTSGNRTLSSYGVATVQKVATDTWFVDGVGLS